MIQLVTVFAAAVALTLGAPNPNPVNVFKIDITPEEAQQYLNTPPFTEPQLSGRTGVLPLVRFDSPQFRTAEAGPTLGHYWKNGHEIENTDDYVEEVYDASQFHGQDGLGAYAYGYKTPESAKVENRVRSGDVTGSYTYRTGNDLIKVRYWADSEGFHQEDNLPKVELKPNEDTEEVKLAILAHQKAWQEAANAAAQQPDPQGEYSESQYQQQGSGSQGNYQFQASSSAPQPNYNNQYQPSQYQAAASEPHPNIQYQAAASEPHPNIQYQAAASEPHPNIQYQGAASESQGVSAPAPREGKAYGSGQAGFGQQQQLTQAGQSSSQSSQSSAQYQSTQYGQQKQQYGQQKQQYGQQTGYGQQQQGSEEPEPTGPPRGFFYSFDYPVSILVRKDAQGQSGPVNPGQPIDADTVGVNANAQRYG